MIRTNNKVALYARFSSDNQRSESIDAQVRAMTVYCKQRNYIIVETYIDEAKSATTDRRPAFQQMINDSKSKTFDILLVHKLDRFARNRYDSAVYKRELKKNGVQVFSVLENLDDSPESIMMEAVLEGMSEYYSQNLARETMKGMKETALQCKHTGGIPPLGYDIDAVTRKLIINDTEAKTVKLIFDMYSQGQGYSAILDKLYEMRYKTKRGTDFTKNSLYGILTNPKYSGMYVFNRVLSKSVTGTRNSHMYKDNEEIIAIDGGCPQIIDKETFNNVQERILAHKHTGGRANAKVSYLLSGKVFCKDCGRAMVGNSHYSGRNKTLHVTYRCPSNKHCCNNKEINRDYLENFVVSLLEKEILNKASLSKLKRTIEKHAESNSNNSSNQAESRLKEVEIALKNVADAVAAGLLSDALIQRLSELENEKSALQKQQSTQESAKEKLSIDPQVILADYNSIKSSPSSPTYKDFVTSFIERIDIGRYNVAITLKTGLDIFPPLNSVFNIRRQEIYEQRKTVS